MAIPDPPVTPNTSKLHYLLYDNSGSNAAAIWHSVDQITVNSEVVGVAHVGTHLVGASLGSDAIVVVAGVDGTTIRAIAVNADGEVGIYDGGNSITVDGTVTADAGTGPWPVTDNGGSLTVDGSVSITGTVDTELPSAVALADAEANPTVPAVGSYLMGFNGTTWDRVRTANTGRLQVDVVTGGSSGVQYTEGDTDATITGTALLWEDTGDTLRVVSVAKPLPISDAGGSLTVDGTVAATQSGTWNLNNISGTISLPTGAATAALQTQPGVDIGDVTINNAAGASAVNIQDGGNSITIDGAVTVSSGTVSVSGTVTVDSELPAAAALADATANPTVPGVGGFLMGFNGTTWDRVRTANTGRLQVDIVSGGSSGVQYTESDVDTTITGTAILWEDTGDTLRAVSAAKPLPISDAGGSLTVDGTVAISGTVTVDSELPAAAALADATANPTVPGVGGFLMGFNGTTWDRVRTANTGRLQVDIVSGGSSGAQYTEGDVDATITGTAIMWEDTGDTLRAVSAAKPLPISDAGGSLTVDGTVAVSGTVAVTQSGTWVLGANSGVDIGDVTVNNAAGASAVNIQDGGNSITVDGTVTANLAAGTNNIGDVDVLTVPAPLSTTGGGTEATALRVTLANDSTGVISVDDNGGSLTVDGTVSISGTVTVDTELPAAAALADATANPTVPGVGGFLMGFNGTTWDRVRTANTGRLQVDVVTGGTGGVQYTEGDTDTTITGTAMLMEGAANTLVPAQGTVADGLLVNLGANNDVTVTGTVTANAGTNLNTSLLALEAGGNLATITSTVVNSFHAEDSASANGDSGNALLAVRKATPANTSSTDGDYEFLQMSEGRLWTSTVVTDAVTIIDNMEATTGWSALNSDTTGLATTTKHITGTLALTFDKVNGAANTIFGGIQKTLTSMDLSAYSFNSSLVLTALVSTKTAIRFMFIRLGTDASNYSEWRSSAMSAGEFFSSYFPINQADPDLQVGTGCILSAVTYVVVGAGFSLQSDTLSGIIIDHVAITTENPSVLPGTGQTHIGRAVDDFFDRQNEVGTVGVMPLGIINGSTNFTALSSVADDGYYAPFSVDEFGRIHVKQTTNPPYANVGDSVANITDAAVPALAVRKATPANLSDTDGDYEFLQVSNGRLWASTVVEPPDATILGTAVSVTTSATALPTTALTSRKRVVIQNRSTTASLYVGGSGVTTSNGMEIPPTWSQPFEAGPNMAIFGVASTGTIDARVLELS